MISKSTSFVSLGFSSSLFCFFLLFSTVFCLCHCTLKYLGLGFHAQKQSSNLEFVYYSDHDGQCLLQAKLRGRAMSFFSLGNLPKAAIIPQFMLLELFHLYRFAKHMVKIKLLIFP